MPRIARKPIVGKSGFKILVVPTADIVTRGVTIPETVFARQLGDKPLPIRVLASASSLQVGCSPWSMSNKAAVAKTLRALAKWVEHDT